MNWPAIGVNWPAGVPRIQALGLYLLRAAEVDRLAANLTIRTAARLICFTRASWSKVLAVVQKSLAWVGSAASLSCWLNNRTSRFIGLAAVHMLACLPAEARIVLEHVDQ